MKADQMWQAFNKLLYRSYLAVNIGPLCGTMQYSLIWRTTSTDSRDISIVTVTGIFVLRFVMTLARQCLLKRELNPPWRILLDRKSVV